MNYPTLAKPAATALENDPEDQALEAWMRGQGSDVELATILMLVGKGMSVPPANDGLWGEL